MELATLNDFKYVLGANNEIILTEYVGEKNSIEIPSTMIIDGIERYVTGLGESCFEDNRQIDEVKLNDGIKVLGDRCFAYSKLRNIELSNTVTFVGERCFSGSTLEYIDFKQVEKVAPRTCQQCQSLKKAILSPNMTEIAEYLFLGCDKLDSLYIPASIETIDSHAFHGTYSLYDVQIDGDNFALYNDKITLYNKKNNTLIYVLYTDEDLYKMPDFISDIQTGAIFDLSVNVIVFSEQITYLPEKCVYDCDFLIHLSLPGVIEMAEDAIFSNCFALHLNKDVNINSNFFYGDDIECIFFNGTKEDLETNSLTTKILDYDNIKNAEVFYFKDFDELSKMGYNISEINQIFQGYNKNINLSISTDKLNSNLLRNFIHQIDVNNSDYYMWVDAYTSSDSSYVHFVSKDEFLEYFYHQLSNEKDEFNR